MKRVIRCRTDTNDYTSIDLDLSDMISDKIGRKLFGKIMNIPDEHVESYLQGCVDICQLANIEVPGLEEIYNSVLENGVNETLQTMKNI